MTDFEDLPPDLFSKANQILGQAIIERAFPGAVLAIGHCERLAVFPAGRLTYESNSAAVTSQTIYDLASLTKVVATAPMAMLLTGRGRLKLDDPVAKHLPEFGEQDNGGDSAVSLADRSRVTIRHLLAHTAGLPAYEKFFLRARKREHVLEEACALPLEAPPGERTLYSDIGFILLGEILERAAGEGLESFCRRELFAPLGMSSTLFNPPPQLMERIAPTEQDNQFRHRLVRGEVHDENAWVMGGVAGHAGLFSTAGDLAQFCQFMLQEGSWKGNLLIRAETIREFTRSHPARADEIRITPRGLGWDKPSAPSSSGQYFSAASYGHLGYTGASMWIDPEKQLFVVLLTNRIHPTRDNDAIRAVRPALHDAIIEALGLAR